MLFIYVAATITGLVIITVARNSTPNGIEIGHVNRLINRKKAHKHTHAEYRSDTHENKIQDTADTQKRGVYCGLPVHIIWAHSALISFIQYLRAFLLNCLCNRSPGECSPRPPFYM